MGLQENMLTESISQLALRKAIVVDPTTLIRDAVVLMRSKRLGCVIVATKDGMSIRVFTEHELMKLLVRDASVVDERVGNHLAPNWAIVKQSDPIVKALQAMRTNHMWFVCVTNVEGQAVALTGQKGLIEYIATYFPRAVLTQTPSMKAFTERARRSLIMSDSARHETSVPEFKDPFNNHGPANRHDRLEKALLERTVDAVESEPCAIVAPDMPVHQAAQRLANVEVGCLVVADKGRLAGVFTERNVLDNVALQYDEVKDCSVSQVMTPEPEFVHDSAPVGAALCVMASRGQRHVPVLGSNGRIVGIVNPLRVTSFLQRYFENE